MRRRLLLLLMLSALLFGLRILPDGAIPAVAAADTLIWIDLQAMSLTLYQNGEEAGRWPIAGGTGATPTPIGVFRVTRKFITQPSGFGTRFIGINVPWGQYAIHGTNLPGSIGSRASHGCIRMFTKDVEKLYRMTPYGTTVVIEDGPYGGLGYSLKTLSPGQRDTQVLVAQQRLRVLGYYQGGLDGIYGAGLSAAVKRFRVDQGLPPQDRIDKAAWDAMGVLLFE